MRILLVESYFSGSHRAWAEGYAAHSTHEVRLLTHPGRWWKWRMRGAALTLARNLDLDGWQPDLVLISDMIDLAQFRTFARHHIGDVPTVLYLHESQLTYPDSPRSDPDLSFAVINWLSAVAADAVMFNSAYHQRIFFEELPRLLRRFPDLKHDFLIAEVEGRSQVLPVGVDLSWVEGRAESNLPPKLLWNHRWDHDKDPDTFAFAVEQLMKARTEFELVLLGPRPPTPPPALERIRDFARDLIVFDQEAPVDLYRKLVATSDVVISTARQEFFGISVVEAVAAGCRPVLPDRLSYPELIPTQFHERVLYSESDLVERLTEALGDPVPAPDLASSINRYSWQHLAPVYDRRLLAVASQSDWRPSPFRGQ